MHVVGGGGLWAHKALQEDGAGPRAGGRRRSTTRVLRTPNGATQQRNVCERRISSAGGTRGRTVCATPVTTSARSGSLRPKSTAAPGCRRTNHVLRTTPCAVTAQGSSPHRKQQPSAAIRYFFSSPESKSPTFKPYLCSIWEHIQPWNKIFTRVIKHYTALLYILTLNTREQII